MSHFATPFIVVNLGCEMLYVIDQRLKAQNIELSKSDRVLTDITTVLLHPKLLDELFIPQPVASHAVIKQLLQDISATSIMKLDEYSMNKLWDLMTMIFKWQLSVAANQNIFDITRRHLKSVATLIPEHFPKSIIEDSMKRFDIIIRKFSDDDYKCLINTMILWFSEYHTKISILLRLGLQRKDGTFSLPASINAKILQKLGENIYKYDNKKDPDQEYENRCAETNEISCLLAPMEKSPPTHGVVKLELPIEIGKEFKKRTIAINRDTQFANINISVKATRDADLAFTADIPKTTQEDLLDMLDDIN